MKFSLALLATCVATLLAATHLAAQTPGSRTLLPNGWSLTPAGHSIPLSSDLPLNMAFSPDGVHLAVTNNGGGRQTIDLINLKQRRLVASVTIKKAWLGLAFAKQHPWLYASGGNDDIIIRYQLTGDTLISKDTIRLGQPWPGEKISPTGLALDEARDRLYVVTKENNSLYVCDTKSMTVVTRIPLGAEAYTVLLNPDKPELYISAWGGSKVWVFDTRRNVLTDSIPTDDHPTDMAIDGDSRLYVANANSNSVSVIALPSNKVIETLHTALSPDAPIGSTTNSLCLSPDGKTLYIANADNNYLALFDVSDPGHSRSLGFIPVGWYPTCVRMHGGQIFVTNGKGLSSMPNPLEPQPGERQNKNAYKKSGEVIDQYVGSMLKGTLSVIPVPTTEALAAYTGQVYANTPYSALKEQEAPGIPGSPIPRKAGEISPIKYVFYVLKENRTYDQILGDLPQGNGDTSLCLFGRQVTPNAHSIVTSFVLLDNFYVDAEVSADGHNWSMAAYATDFTEKTWPTNYSGRGGEYDFDGHRPVANPTKGFIWNYCQRAGVSFRNYGEFEDNGPPTLDILKDPAHYCRPYTGWNLDTQDVRREQIFEQDFDSLEKIGAVPHFSTIYLPNDHTSGLARGAYNPIAMIADNDLALGRLVDHISHSPIWSQSAIFVLEDDAQDGPDHVDAHRSPAYIISPYIKHGFVDHTMYSTTSILRTMELILGLPVMSQYDAAATPMWNSFTATPDNAPFTALPAGTDINMRNTAMTPSAILSSQFDLSRADAVPDDLLNQVLWKAVRGESSVAPAPRRSAFVKVTTEKEDKE
ncbi:MAG TPA: bifunctional YncE family protein/alkaline phosphatase family protein [Puia sp.]|jgi:YVTN family beta-propeller protein|nr:bifunctional YncE family protein/alkaline phosphatase family protein [Puia sp.]